jgi:hypothetical protein
MQIEKDGELLTIKIPWQAHWKVIQLPIFDPPAYITGAPYSGGITSNSMDVFELSEQGEEIAKRHDADRVLPPKFQNEDFARFIAKMAYGYAVERYGLSAFEEVYVLPAILGQANDVGRWVGCSDRRELPVRRCFISVAFRIFPDRDLLVKIKMFPQFDGAEYITVVGRLRESYLQLIPGPW